MFRTIRQRLSCIYPDGEASAIVFLVLDKRFGLSRTDVLMGRAESLNDKQQEELEAIVTRLEAGEPVQYIIGETEFCGLNIHVEPGVLIPRPETEELIEWVIEELGVRSEELGVSHPDKNSSLLDIGTGSGCIALSLAHRLPQVEVTAWDISDDALRIASDNAKRLGLNVKFEKRDVLRMRNEELGMRNYHAECVNPIPNSKFLIPNSLYDLIVSNPPYICESERKEMSANVLDHEPSLALFVPDTDPLLFYRAIATNALHMLRPGGALFFEINRQYGKETVEMLQQLGYTEIELRKDFMNNDRMVKAIRPLRSL